MSRTWELLDKFPDLLKYTNLQDQTQEADIKEWILEAIREFSKGRTAEKN